MIADIINIINTARNTTGRIWIKGYVKEDGSVGDYHLTLRDRDFYPSLLAEAVKWLAHIEKQGAEGLVAAVPEAATYVRQSAEEAMQVVSSLLQQLRVKLASGTSQSEEPHDNIFVGATPDYVILKNLEVLQKPPEVIKCKKAGGVDVTKSVTRLIREAWPVQRYGGQFKLKAGKFECIQVSE